MARKSRNKGNTKIKTDKPVSGAAYIRGKSTSDLLNIDVGEFMSLTRTQLAKVVSRLGSTIKKRVDTMLKKDAISPAVGKLAQSGGDISVAGKNLKDLRLEYKRAQGFLQSKTSTYSGWREVQDKTIKTLQSRYGIEIDYEQLSDIWRSYDRLREIDPSVANRGQKYRVLGNIVDFMVDNETVDANLIVSTIKSQLNDIYVQSQQSIIDELEKRGLANFF